VAELDCVSQRKEDELKPHISVALVLLTFLLNGISYFCLMMGSGLQPNATLLSVPISALLGGWIVAHMQRFRGVVAPLIAIGIVIGTAFAFVAETHRNFSLAKAEAGAMALRIREHHAASGAWPDAITTVWLHGFYLHYKTNHGAVPVLVLGRREWRARWNWETSRWDKSSRRLTRVPAAWQKAPATEPNGVRPHD
jgi:hypothetical protein